MNLEKPSGQILERDELVFFAGSLLVDAAEAALNRRKPIIPFGRLFRVFPRLSNGRSHRSQ